MMLSSGCQAGVSPTPHELRLPPQAKAKLAYGAAQPLCVGTELLSDSLQSRIKQADTGQDESFLSDRMFQVIPFIYQNEAGSHFRLAKV